MSSPLPRRSMVRWFSPSVLVRTGIDVFVSTLLGKHADYRKLEGLHHPRSKPFFDCCKTHADGEAFWFDFVADTGDGWAATYAVAHYISQSTLTLADPSGAKHDTERGRALIFGGDQVYPLASRDEYQARLIEPFEAAARAADQQADSPISWRTQREVYAIPGNHDWYDSLVSFTRLFCGQREFAFSPTLQTRSYFALRLPYGWWLLGADIQLDSDIDEAQAVFFARVANKMEPEDRVILCVAEPYWILRQKYGEKSAADLLPPTSVVSDATQAVAREGLQKIEQGIRKVLPAFRLGDARFSERPLEILERSILKRPVSVFIAGDYHHYRRFATEDGAFQKITAGGGGAFLHPTHDLQPGITLRDERGERRYRLCDSQFPDAKTSARLCWRNLLFPFLNWEFGLVLGFLYAWLAWPAAHALAAKLPQQASLGPGLLELLNQQTPGSLLTLLALYVFGIMLTDTHKWHYRLSAGVLHITTHVLVAWMVAVAAGWCLAPWLSALGVWPFLQTLLVGVFVAFVGAAIGLEIWGIYLLISLNVFKRHANEAFSALRIENYKNFLRMKVDADGTLSIYPVGIERIPRWRGEEFDPASGSAPQLIEAPIRLRRR